MSCNHRVIDADRGAYYLGATTPDIRALTRCDRERTHFFTLNDFGQQERRAPPVRGAARAARRDGARRDHGGVHGGLHLAPGDGRGVHRARSTARSSASAPTSRDDLMANVMDRLLLYHLDKQRPRGHGGARGDRPCADRNLGRRRGRLHRRATRSASGASVQRQIGHAAARASRRCCGASSTRWASRAKRRSRGFLERARRRAAARHDRRASARSVSSSTCWTRRTRARRAMKEYLS